MYQCKEYKSPLFQVMGRFECSHRGVVPIWNFVSIWKHVVISLLLKNCFHMNVPQKLVPPLRVHTWCEQCKPSNLKYLVELLKFAFFFFFLHLIQSNISYIIYTPLYGNTKLQLLLVIYQLGLINKKRENWLNTTLTSKVLNFEKCHSKIWVLKNAGF
jgi:hypothetical protein